MWNVFLLFILYDEMDRKRFPGMNPAFLFVFSMDS